jgi:hypothetical protein
VKSIGLWVAASAATPVECGSPAAALPTLHQPRSILASPAQVPQVRCLNLGLGFCSWRVRMREDFGCRILCGFFAKGVDLGRAKKRTRTLEPQRVRHPSSTVGKQKLFELVFTGGWNKWIRLTHRWLSVAFMLAVIINGVAVAQKAYTNRLGLLAVFTLPCNFSPVCTCSHCHTPPSGAARDAPAKRVGFVLGV